MMKNPKAKGELAYAKAMMQKNEGHSMLFASLSHLLTLGDNSSVVYIENTSIPFLMKEHEYHRIMELYEVMENHFVENGDELKALRYKAASYDLYKKIMQGDDTHEKEIY